METRGYGQGTIGQYTRYIARLELSSARGTEEPSSLRARSERFAEMSAFLEGLPPQARTVAFAALKLYREFCTTEPRRRRPAVPTRERTLALVR
jgi:hypothetical protein